MRARTRVGDFDAVDGARGLKTDYTGIVETVGAGTGKSIVGAGSGADRGDGGVALADTSLGSGTYISRGESVGRTRIG